MSLTESLVQTAIRELGETKCAACDEAKERKQSFCRACYFSLPQNMRRDLYKPFSEGYAEAYDEAKDWLRVNR